MYNIDIFFEKESNMKQNIVNAMVLNALIVIMGVLDDSTFVHHGIVKSWVNYIVFEEVVIHTNS